MGSIRLLEAIRVRTVVVPYHHAEPLLGLADAVSGATSIVVSKGPAGTMLVSLYDLVANRVAASDEPITVISGDCTTSLAIVAGLQRRGLDPSVLWLDAHGDFHTPRTTISGYLSGMALAMLTGRTGAALTGPIGLRPIDEARCVLAGVRDLDPPEREALDASRVRRVDITALAGAALPPSPWYVHIDVDVVDPAELPPLRFPAPGGPSVDAVAAALRAVAARGTIAALGVGCTFTPAAIGAAHPLEPISPLIAALA